MALSFIEAVHLLRFAAVFSGRLEKASADLSARPGAERERRWLAAASEVLAEAIAKSPGLLDEARRLPEFRELREELAESLQSAWVDALEKLLAGITFHATRRSPVIAALYPSRKLAPLRRASPDAARKFHSDFEKRLKAGYVNRMLATDDFAFARPVIDRIRETHGRWQSCFEDVAIPEAEAASIRAALEAAGHGLEVATRQARHLAEAALAPFPGAFAEHQLGARPKKRTRAESQNAPQPIESAPPATRAPIPTAPAAPGRSTRKSARHGSASDARAQDETRTSAATSLRGRRGTGTPRRLHRGPRDDPFVLR
jgi:hypothetical protein